VELLFITVGATAWRVTGMSRACAELLFQIGYDAFDVLTGVFHLYDVVAKVLAPIFAWLPLGLVKQTARDVYMHLGGLVMAPVDGAVAALCEWTAPSYSAKCRASPIMAIVPAVLVMALVVGIWAYRTGCCCRDVRTNDDDDAHVSRPRKARKTRAMSDTE
jgi:hypothetical protein